MVSLLKVKHAERFANMADGYKRRVSSEQEYANKILAGEAPAQATPGVMSPAERRASIAKAFGAKPPVKQESAQQKDMRELQEALGPSVKVMPEFKKGGKVSSASKRADGCAQRGKTKGRMV